MCTFKDFLRWYNNKNVVPMLEAMQKMVDFYHNKGIDMLKLGCTLPNLANICLQKSTTAKFYPLTESNKDLFGKLREDIVGGPSIVFTRKAVMDETFIRDSTNCAKVLSNLILVSFILSLCVKQCQLVCTRDGSLIRNLASLNRVKTRRFLKTWSCHTFNELDHSLERNVFTRQVHRKKLTHTVLVAFVDTARLC